MPPSEMTATSVVPPPMSTIMFPVGSATGSPGADRGSHRLLDQVGLARAGREGRLLDCALLDAGDAGRHADDDARWAKRCWCTFWMKWRSISSVTSKSAMTPSFSGRIAEMVPGVRPSIRFASTPTAWTWPVRWSIATTDGSESTIPRPRT